MELIEDHFTARTMKVLLDDLALVNEGNLEALQNSIPDESYRVNFMGLSERLAPDGKEITKTSDMFSFNGSKGYFSGKQDVDYANSELPVDVFCESGSGFVAGKYMITIGCDNVIIGETSITLK